MSSPTKIVIVGAGASARILVKSLRASPNGKPDKVNITLIQPNKFASMPYYQTMVLTKTDTLTNNSTFSEVDGVDKTVYGVAVACGDGVLAVQPLNEAGSKDDSASPVEVPFDVLVAATGSSFPVLTETPGQSKEERQKEIDQVSEALLSGKDVVIAGGGSTGVELAADVLENLPADSRKGKVTLICSSDRLLADQPTSYSQRSKEIIEELGGVIIFNDRVVSHQESTIATDAAVKLDLKSGKSITCHVYIAAYDRGPITAWLTSVHGDKTLPTKIVNG
jgi:NADH dehydrogenase FAD-containing subunit